MDTFYFCKGHVAFISGAVLEKERRDMATDLGKEGVALGEENVK